MNLGKHWGGPNQWRGLKVKKRGAWIGLKTRMRPSKEGKVKVWHITQPYLSVSQSYYKLPWCFQTIFKGSQGHGQLKTFMARTGIGRQLSSVFSTGPNQTEPCILFYFATLNFIFLKLLNVVCSYFLTNNNTYSRAICQERKGKGNNSSSRRTQTYLL